METPSYPLSKTLDPERDYAELVEELKIVDQYFGRGREQHPHRRFEYALARRAITTWATQVGATRRLVDVGGAGSPFRYMVQDYLVTVIDPEETVSLEEYLASRPYLADVVTCLSVLEHVDDLDRFLYHLSCLVAPGGLLFLTMDACDQFVDDWPEDQYHFHWMRQRIFNQYGWRLGVAAPLLDRDFTLFGETDWTYHGDQVYGYTFASLALIKRA